MAWLWGQEDPACLLAGLNLCWPALCALAGCVGSSLSSSSLSLSPRTSLDVDRARCELTGQRAASF